MKQTIGCIKQVVQSHNLQRHHEQVGKKRFHMSGFD